MVRVELSVNPDVSFYLLNKKRQSLARLEYDTGRKILIRSDATLGLDEMRLELFDIRDGVVILPELSSLQQVPHKTQLNTRPAGPIPQQRGGRPGGGRPDDRQKNDRRPGQRPPAPQHRHHPEEEEREEFDQDMQAIEDRADEFDRDDREESGSPPDEAPAERGPRRPEINPPIARNVERGPKPAFPGNNGAPGNDQDAMEQDGEGGKRRRRRRRRRGRGRGGQNGGQEGQQAPLDAPGADLNRPAEFDDFEDRPDADAARDHADSEHGDESDTEVGDRAVIQDRDQRGDPGVLFLIGRNWDRRDRYDRDRDERQDREAARRGRRQGP